MSTPVDLRELIERLQIAISQLEEAEEVVGEASIEIRNKIERIQRESVGKWSDQMIEAVNFLDFSSFQRPVNLADAYIETGQLQRVCNWIEELEKLDDQQDEGSS